MSLNDKIAETKAAFDAFDQLPMKERVNYDEISKARQAYTRLEAQRHAVTNGIDWARFQIRDHARQLDAEREALGLMRHADAIYNPVRSAA